MIFINTLPNIKLNQPAVSEATGMFTNNHNWASIKTGIDADHLQNSRFTKPMNKISPQIPTPVSNITLSYINPGSSFYSPIDPIPADQANLSGIKNVDLQYAGLSSTLTYEITLINSSNTSVDHILFVDTIPNGTTLVAGSLNQDQVPISGSPNPPGVTLPTFVDAYSMSTISFQVFTDTVPTINSLSNSAWISFQYAGQPEGKFQTLETNTVVTTISYAQLGKILKSVSNAYAAVGDILTYTIVISNIGNSTVSDIVLIDTIPEATKFIDGSLKQDGHMIFGIPDPPGVMLPDPIAAGGTTTVSFQVQVTTIPPITSFTIPNWATAFYSYPTTSIFSANSNQTSNTIGIDVDSHLIANSATATFSYPISPTSIGTGEVISNIEYTLVNSPLMTFQKSVDRASALVGETLTYTISLTNTGNTTAFQTIFYDTIPDGTTFISDSLFVNGAPQTGSPASPGIVLPDLGMNETTTVTFQVLATAVPNFNPTVNAAVSCYNFIVDPFSQSVRNVETITNSVSTYIYPNNSNFKTADKSYAGIGDSITYGLIYSNTQDINDIDLTFIDTIPGGLNFVPGSLKLNGINQPLASPMPPEGFHAGTLPYGSSAIVTFDVVVNGIPPINPTQNQATFTYKTTLPTKPFSSTVTNTVSTQINYANLDGLCMVPSHIYATCGDTITYTITLPNSGNVTANNVILSDTVPNGTQFIPGSMRVNGISTSDTPDHIVVGDIGPGAIATVMFDFKITC